MTSPHRTDAGEPWPELPWQDWRPTIDTLHMWVQIVGKVRMALAPPLNHWWHVPLYVSARGLTTSTIPSGNRHFQVDFDFIDHQLRVADSDGGVFALPLEPMSVARFHAELMAGLRELRVDVRISTKPVEVAEAIPFESDETHASYDQAHATAFWRGLLQADRVMKAFQSGFVGKASPVQFFWGSFDLAAARYSGRMAPVHPGGAPNCPDWVMVEAYSREESSHGWWPSSEPPGPAFYAYTYPEPDGFRSAPVRPAAASYDARLGEFTLPYDAIRAAADPDAAVLAFLQSTYDAGADLGGWDRVALEPWILPRTPADRPWSVADPDRSVRLVRQAAAPAPGDATHRHRSRRPD
jgi:hypothetical protein